MGVLLEDKYCLRGAVTCCLSCQLGCWASCHNQLGNPAGNLSGDPSGLSHITTVLLWPAEIGYELDHKSTKSVCYNLIQNG